MNNRHLVSRVCRPVFVAAVALALALSAGCSAAGNDDDASTVLAPLASMPQEVQDAPVPVQEAYRFAIAHPDLMTQIPCYCGCGSMGHTSNYACYASGTDEAGNILFDSHALGCSICVDITLDARHLFEQGKPAEEIRAYIDDVYSPYGPSNMP
jgi:hypothetical protein